jgi:hypothetical protein
MGASLRGAKRRGNPETMNEVPTLEFVEEFWVAALHFVSLAMTLPDLKGDASFNSSIVCITPIFSRCK